MAFKLGSLFVDQSAVAVWWAEHVVPLTAGERLMVSAIARAEGQPIKRIILAEIVGCEDTQDPENSIAVMLSRINAKFREIDSAFDRIENVRGQGLRWRTEA